MREIRTSGSMSGDGKRGVGHRPQATAPFLDSTSTADLRYQCIGRRSEANRTHRGCGIIDANDPSRPSGLATEWRKLTWQLNLAVIPEWRVRTSPGIPAPP